MLLLAVLKERGGCGRVGRLYALIIVSTLVTISVFDIDDDDNGTIVNLLFLYFIISAFNLASSYVLNV